MPYKCSIIMRVRRTWITCHLVTFLHFDRSLPSRLVSLIEGPSISLMVISNLVIGLPYFLFLLIHQTSHHSLFTFLSRHMSEIPQSRLYVPPSIPVSILARCFRAPVRQFFSPSTTLSSLISNASIFVLSFLIFCHCLKI